MASRRPVAYAALLPGINVGGNKKVAMPVLRSCFEAAGGTDVATYIQSGNVVFRSAQARKPLVAALEQAIAEGTGHEVRVVLRTGAELQAVVDGNPYPDLDGSQLHVLFVDGAASTVVRDIDAEAFAPETFTIVGHEIYLGLPNGMGRAKLPSKLLKPKPPTAVTARNWNTVLKLRAMVDELGD
jgi:uncharacterized protein (DUF1697 family)